MPSGQEIHWEAFHRQSDLCPPQRIHKCRESAERPFGSFTITRTNPQPCFPQPPHEISCVETVNINNHQDSNMCHICSSLCISTMFFWGGANMVCSTKYQGPHFFLAEAIYMGVPLRSSKEVAKILKDLSTNQNSMEKPAMF